jgi:hypothetical protein
MAQPEELTVKKRGEPELLDRIEKALTDADALVEIDGRAWRVVDFVRDDYAVLVLQAE